MNSLNTFRIEQPSLVQALDKYREMEKVLVEEREKLQDTIDRGSLEWQGSASEATVQEVSFLLTEGNYNMAYENVRTMRTCMENTLEQVNALLVRSEEFPKQLQSSAYIEPMRPAKDDNTTRNGGALYLDYGKAMIIPELCEEVSEAATYLGNVLIQQMEACRGIIDDVPGYINRVEEAVHKIKRIENYKQSFQGYVQGVRALENDVYVQLSCVQRVETVGGRDETIDRSLDRAIDKDIVIVYGKEILENCLIEAEYDNSLERQIIIDYITKNHPDLLISLYGVDRYSTADKVGIIKLIIQKYNEYNEDNHLEDVQKFFEEDENRNQYEVYVEYVEYLRIANYICPAEYENIMEGLNGDAIVSNDKIEFLENLMVERDGLLSRLASTDEINENLTLPAWEKIEVVTALQIEIEMLEAGYDEEFVYGLIGNMKRESGKFGGIEGLFNTTEVYGLHVIDCVDHLEKYSMYDMTEVNLFELYFERTICLNPIEETNMGGKEKEIHKWGIGAFQWTPKDRAFPLLEKYLKEVGYIITADGLAKEGTETTVITAENYMSISPVYLTFEQVMEADMEHLKEELDKEKGAFKAVYNIYYMNEVTSDDFDANIREATKIIKEKYVINYDGTLEERQENALRWRQEREKEKIRMNVLIN